MKKLNNILVALMLVSSINLLSEFTNIKFSNFFTPLHANEQSEISDFIVLKKINTEISPGEPIVFMSDSAGVTVKEVFIMDESTSIYIRKDAKVKIDRDGDTRFDKMRQYTFQFYNPQNNTITLENKKTGRISVSVDALSSISARLDELKQANMPAGILGGVIAGGVAFYPSVITGLVLGMGMAEVFGDGFFPAITCLATTAAGTLTSMKLGYDYAQHIGNPYIQISLKGEDAWEISSE